ncbi:MAG: hypothetical protein KAT37_01835 [Candidatus Aenigmarchaeota archaeon]|nr:hypothetical protein [Candidatus Aenigmarchaeota archaeon]
MTFYNPEIVRYREIPVIVYPEKGVEKHLDRKREGIITDHIRSTYELNKNRFKTLGDYHIDFLWNHKENLMTDVWVQSKIDEWDSGPLSNPKVFKKANGVIKPDNNIEKASGNVHIVLGLEEIHRRHFNNFDSYITGKRPDLPFNLSSGENFHIL